MQLARRDFDLSNRISRPRRDGQEIHDLRNLIVRRLSGDDKAVYRVPLSLANASIYCEPCRHWFRQKEDPEPEWRCPGCGQLYEIEFAVYAAVEDNEDDTTEPRQGT